MDAVQKRDEARRYLNDVLYMRYDIQREGDHINELRYAASGVRAITYDSDRVQTSPVNRLEDIIAELDAVEKLYAEHIRDLHKTIQRKTDEVNGMSDKTMAEILKRRYLTESAKRPSWNSIASKMAMSCSYIRRKHMDALEAFYDEVLKK